MAKTRYGMTKVLITCGVRGIRWKRPSQFWEENGSPGSPFLPGCLTSPNERRKRRSRGTSDLAELAESGVDLRPRLLIVLTLRKVEQSG